MLNIGILGATGYSGEELLRLLLRHSKVKKIKIFSSKHAGSQYTKLYRNYYGERKLILEPLNWSTVHKDIDILFSALPYGTLMENITEEMIHKTKIIDIGVDYRFMDKMNYKKYYGSIHKNPHMRTYFSYGLSEWNRVAIKEARHIANPGCYATAAQLSLIPLLKDGIIEDNDIIIDCKGGYSAAGRSLSLGTHYVEGNESVKAYKITRHPHSFEICKGVELFTGESPEITFVPHMIPMQRGILSTIYCKLKNHIDEDAIRACFFKYYEPEPFIELLPKGIYVESKWVRGCNKCHINFEVDKESNRLIVISAIDNLLKGAAGQAIQNMNIIYGYSELEGLDIIPTCI